MLFFAMNSWQMHLIESVTYTAKIKTCLLWLVTSFFYGFESAPKYNVNSGFHRKPMIEQQSILPTICFLKSKWTNLVCVCVALALHVFNETKSRRCLPSVIWSFSAPFKGRLASQSQCVHCQRKSDRRRIVWKGSRRKSEVRKNEARFSLWQSNLLYSELLMVGGWVTRPHIKDMELLLFCVHTKCWSREGGAPCH